MTCWAPPPQKRDQIVLCPERLDEVLPADHAARLLDEILESIDFLAWEAEYDGHPGQPPIHPRVLASVLLDGPLARIRTSRALEEALSVRLEFRWLAEGRSIDHTTLSEFRRKNGEAQKKYARRPGPKLTNPAAHETVRQENGRPDADPPASKTQRGEGGDQANPAQQRFNQRAVKAKVCIKPNATRKVKKRDNREVYKHRNQIERFFGRMKRCRRVATRYEKKAANFAGFIWLAALITDMI